RRSPSGTACSGCLGGRDPDMTDHSTAVPELDPGLVAFLMALSVALHKHRAYPEGHPLRSGAVESTFARLEGLLSARPALRVGVARRQLIVDGIPSDPAHPVLRELAERLHRRQVGAVIVQRGIALAEWRAALAHLSLEYPGRGAHASASSDWSSEHL